MSTQDDISLKNRTNKAVPTKVVMPKAKTPKVTLPKRQRGASILGSAEQDSIRYKWVWGLMLLGFVALISRAFYVQVLNKDYFQDQGNKLITTVRKEPSYRGMITDRNNMPLAVSAPLITLTDRKSVV